MERRGISLYRFLLLLKMAEEGYRLTVTAKGVVIKAKTAKGAFYGMQSFMQLLPAQIESATQVDGCEMGGSVL